MSKAKPRIQKRLESSDRVSEVGVGFSNPSFAFDSPVGDGLGAAVLVVVEVPVVSVELVVAVVPVIRLTVVAVILVVDSCKVEVIVEVVDIRAVVIIVVILVVVVIAVVVSNRFTLKYFKEVFI